MRLIDLENSGKAIGLASRLDSSKAINITKDLSSFLFEKKIKVAFFTLDFNQNTAYFFAIKYNAVSFTIVNGLLNHFS